MYRAMLIAALLLGLPGESLAGPAKIAVDIAPVHSLVAEVTRDVTEPRLIVPANASPHGHNMRPSEAAALADADLVIWMGPALTPWLEQAVTRLAGDAHSLILLDLPGTVALPYRDDPHFEPHEHAGDDEHEHEHGDIDPHAWLDPENAVLWLAAIADAVSELDPANEAIYRRNAEAAQARITALIEEISTELSPLGERSFIVFHDAYQYFEQRFGLSARGAISHGDAAPPGPRRISAMRALIAETSVICVFAEPQFPSNLIATIIDGTEVNSAVLDPLGVTLQPGPELYPELLRDIAEALQGCLGAE